MSYKDVWFRAYEELIDAEPSFPSKERCSELAERADEVAQDMIEAMVDQLSDRDR